jgi:RNA recognition motif-containing protein
MSSSSSSTSSDSDSSPGSSPPSPRDEVDPSAESGSESESTDSETEGDAKRNLPVLSHAERRRQKRKAEKDSLLAETTSNKKRKTGKTSSGRQNSVWVGNLSFKTTVESLKAFFDGVGEITRVHMPTKASAGGPVKSENRG